MSKERLWLFLEAKQEMLSKGVLEGHASPPKAPGSSLSLRAWGASHRGNSNCSLPT